MIKETIEYEDLEGNKIVEDFYFAIRPSEVVQLEVDYADGFSEFVQKAVADDNKRQIVEIFTTLIRISYGRKHPDGVQFVKDLNHYEEFKNSDAYEQLYLRLMTNNDAAAKFFNDILPKSLIDKVKDLLEEQRKENENKTIEDYTEADLLEMTQDEFFKLAGPKGQRSQRTLQIATKRKIAENARVSTR